jgi:hypothetical protein
MHKMVKVACYINEDGILAVVIPAYNHIDDESDDAQLESFIARKQADGGIPAGVELRILDNSEFPTDRTFRDAWEDLGIGSVQVNLPKARGIHMDKIRLVRNNELANLDVPFMKALEDGDTDTQATIKIKKQELRDIPQTFDLTTDTPEELKNKWPDSLPNI